MFCRDTDEKTVLEYLKKQSQLIEQYIALDPILTSANVSPMLNYAVANLSEIMMSPIILKTSKYPLLTIYNV